MANEAHVQILKLGPKVWNCWREAYPDVTPDLSDARFDGNELDHPSGEVGYNLQSVNCEDTMFLNVFLNGSDFKKAILQNTYFTNSYLEKADFRNAEKIDQADFSGAKVEGLLVCDSVNVGEVFKDTEGRPKPCKC